MEKKRAIFRRTIRRVEESTPAMLTKDSLVAEEPFTLLWQSSDGHSERLTSTMRTPGDDNVLAAGILFSEQVLRCKAELHTLSFCAGGGVNELNRLKAELRLEAAVVHGRLAHRPSSSLPQSACGLCAVDDLSSPETLLKWAASRYEGAPQAAKEEVLMAALACLENDCPLFRTTGASHATVIIGAGGEPLSVAEDVGRHNACDKALGRLLLESRTPDSPFSLPAGAGMLVSSRFSFELAYKGIAAGVSWMASVGAPTHLAAELASRCGVHLYGFVSSGRHNLYI